MWKKSPTGMMSPLLPLLGWSSPTTTIRSHSSQHDPTCQIGGLHVTAGAYTARPKPLPDAWSRPLRMRRRCHRGKESVISFQGNPASDWPTARADHPLSLQHGCPETEGGKPRLPPHIKVFQSSNSLPCCCSFSLPTCFLHPSLPKVFVSDQTQYPPRQLEQQRNNVPQST